MSDAPIPGPAGNSQPAAASSDAALHSGIAGWLSHQMDALQHDAAWVYHEVVAVEADVTAWTEANPAIAPLVQQALSLAEDFVLRCAQSAGVPAPALALVGVDVLAALKQMAAADSTVKSGSAMRQGVAASAPNPGAG